MRKRITDLIDITQDELNSIKDKILNEEKYVLYSDEKLEIVLYKYGKKVYEFIYHHGNKPFLECFKEMVKIRYN